MVKELPQNQEDDAGERNFYGKKLQRIASTDAGGYEDSVVYPNKSNIMSL